MVFTGIDGTNCKEDMMETLTIAEIASRLELPESTVRYYRDRFATYIPVVGKGRGRRYPGEAVEIFRTIAEGLRSGQTAALVDETLSRLFPRNIETVQTELAQATAAAPQQVAQAMVHVLFQQQEEIQAMRLSLEQIQADLNDHHEQNVSRMAEAFDTLKSHLDVQDNQNTRMARERDQFIVSQMREFLQPKPETKSWWKKLRSKNTSQASARS
jgi:DNA-binding transcriptional MerR regulator